MTIYEQRLEADLDALRASVLDLARRVRSNLSQAIAALTSGDDDLAYRTILADHPVNRETERIEADCHRFIARHLPAAGHLRFVSSAMRMAILLERVGDYATTICRESVQFRSDISGVFRDKVSRMANDSVAMFSRAIEAFEKRDEALARATMQEADGVDREFADAFGDLLASDVGSLGMKDVFGRLIVIMQIERVSDQAKNLCEETVFALTGQTKRRRPVRVLFVDESEAAYASLAVAIARRQHPTTGVYGSLGSSGAPDVGDAVRRFLDDRGLGDPSVESPTSSPVDWASWDVVVSLSGPVGRIVGDMPFHTVGLSWEAGGSIEDRYRFLSNAIAELMDTLRGPDPAT